MRDQQQLQLNALLPLIGQLMQESKLLTEQLENQNQIIRQYEALFQVMMQQLRKHKFEETKSNDNER